MSSVTTPSGTPYDSAIEEIRSKLQEMTGVLNTLLGLQAAYTGVSSAPMAVRGAGDTDVQHDSFFGMTIGDAARKYLTMVKTAKSTAEIAIALEEGGLKHTSKDFPTTVRSIIGPREEFVRVPNGGWGLAEWYPGMGRGKKTKPEKSAKSKRKARTKGATLESRILDAMKTDLTKDWVSSELAGMIGAERTSVQSVISRLAKEGKRVTKATKGYRLTNQHPVAA